MSDFLYMALGLTILFVLVEGPDLVIRFLNRKNKKSFWDSSFRLMSDRGRDVISNPDSSKKLADEVRKQRRKQR